MTRPKGFVPRNPALEAIADDIAKALAAGRFDDTFFRTALQRVADAGGGFNDNHRVLMAAQEAGLLRSPLTELRVTPTHRWDPVTRRIVPI